MNNFIHKENVGISNVEGVKNVIGGNISDRLK
jgi:hypothetical protein